MEIGIIVRNGKLGVDYFSSTDPIEINGKLLNNNPNNSLNVGYKFELDRQLLEIIRITIPEIVNKEVNGVNAFLILFVKPL